MVLITMLKTTINKMADSLQSAAQKCPEHVKTFVIMPRRTCWRWLIDNILEQFMFEKMACMYICSVVVWNRKVDWH